MRTITLLCVLAIISSPGPWLASSPAIPASLTYYVSSSSGSDNNDGLSPSAPFLTVNKVNSLSLLPGDSVLFKCGDVWRVDPLLLSSSGISSAPITFNSYPAANCANKPVLSGSRPINGWSVDSGNVYTALLSPADFPNGLNQLFRNNQRLTMGRWPNIDAPNGGYSFVDSHTAGGNQVVDNELPALNWTGAIVHIKNIRWSMLDRQVTSSSGHTLTLNQGLSCLISGWGSCTGWGFFINNSRNTLDQDGEWYYDSASHRVYLYSSSGSPNTIEGSVVQATGDLVRNAGIMLSNGSATSYAVIDNFEVENWFNDGIGTPGGMSNDIYHHLTIRNATVRNVDATGVNLSSWLERPTDGRKGLRGGNHLTFTNNVIDGANDFGISGYFSESTFEGNTIKNIALIKNLNKSGMGCGITTGECTENGDGFRIRLYQVQDSGSGNILRYNIFDTIGYNGVDVFGPETTLEKNVISQACFTKADCGGVRTFGDTSLAATTVYNIHLLNNIIVNIPGNVDGCHPSRAAFGIGIYIDNFSRNVETRGNTVLNTTVSGILYQQSSGQIVDNNIFNASSGTEFSAHIDLGGSATSVTMNGNAMYALSATAWTLYTSALSNILSSDQNYFFHPYVNQQIAYGPSWTRQTFAQWKTLSGQDSHSKSNWFTQPAGETSRGKLFFNATSLAATIDLGNRQYLDLDQNPVVGSIILQPYTSRILVDNGPAPIEIKSINPGMLVVGSGSNFTLTVYGSRFTSNSVIRWNGKDYPTTFIDPSRLTTTINASDVSVLGDDPVTVYDPSPAPGGTETLAIQFHVVPAVFQLLLSLISK